MEDIVDAQENTVYCATLLLLRGRNHCSRIIKDIVWMISNPQLVKTRGMYAEKIFWTTSMDVNMEDILNAQEENVVYSATLLLLGCQNHCWRIFKDITWMISNPQLVKTLWNGRWGVYAETVFWTTSMDVNMEDVLDVQENAVYCAALLLLRCRNYCSKIFKDFMWTISNPQLVKTLQNGGWGVYAETNFWTTNHFEKNWECM